MIKNFVIYFFIKDIKEKMILIFRNRLNFLQQLQPYNEKKHLIYLSLEENPKRGYM